MDHQISKLVKRGHDVASELKASCGSVDVRAVAQLISDLATQLDVNRVALTQSRREFTAANATIHNLELKVAQVMSERDVVNADNAYLRGEVICWARECDRITHTYTNKITDAHQLEAERELANTNPAVGAYLAEVLAAEAQSIYEGILDNPAITDMESLVDWLEQHASDAVSFAAQLRQGAEHE